MSVRPSDPSMDPDDHPTRAVGAPRHLSAPAPNPDPLRRRRLALVIGIDAYAHGVAPLTGAVADARAVAAALGDASRLDRYDPVTVLLDGDASREGIARAFEALRAEVAADPLATLLIYFAGHGIATSLPEDAATDTPGYLLPSDARLGAVETFVSMRALRGWVDATACHHLLLVLDCCFAGAFQWAGTRAVRAPPRVLYRERLERYLRDPAWYVLASAAHDERALDVMVSAARLGGRGQVEEASNGGARSPFAAALIEGLCGAADFASAATGRPDGVITGGELRTWLEHRFSAWEQAGRRMQKPLLFPWPGRRDNKGEYVFLNPREALRLESAGELIEASNPYRGFRSYQYSPDDTRLFFGRDAVVQSLFDKVVGAGDNARGEPVVVVLGASGSGKSSLVAAGLLPRLARAGWTPLPQPVRPGENPRDALRLLGRLLDGAAPAHEALPEMARRLFSRDPGARRVVLVDQLEELVTLRREAGAKDAFLETVEAAVEAAEGRLRVLYTLRSDFEPHFEALITRRPTGRFRVPSLSRAELREVIEKPADACVLGFSPASLVGEMVEEVIDAPGALPLLSFTLSEMYLHYVREFAAGRRDDRVLTAADYQDLGRVEGSLSRRAEEVVARFDDDGRTTLRRVMLRMVTIKGAELTRRPVTLAELDFSNVENVRVQAVLDALTDARLIVRGCDELGEFVEPVHDKVVLGWPRLVAWIHDPEERERYDAVQVVRHRTEEWLRLERSNGWLDHDTRLDRWVELVGRTDNPFNADEVALVRASLARRDAERDRERRRVAALEDALARARDQIRTTAARDAADDPTAQAALLREVDRPERTVGWLRLALDVIAQPVASAVLAGHGAEVSHAAFSTDGARALTASADGAVRVWGVDGDAAPIVLRGPPGPIAAAALSADGALALAVGVDRVVRVWRTDGVGEPRLLRGSDARFSAAAFSPDGAHVVAGAFDGAVYVWSLRGRGPAVALKGHQGRVRAATFSSDGARVLTASADHTARVWRVDGGGAPLRLEGHEAEVDDARFSADGGRVVTASRDGTARVWCVDGSGAVVVLSGHTSGVSSAAFSPDGARVVTASVDGTARVWRADGSGDPVVLSGHTARVTSARFSPDGQRMLTASADGTARIWSADGRGQSVALRGHAGAVLAAEYSVDGRRVVTASKDCSARVWSTRAAGDSVRLHGVARSVGFTADGAHVWALGERSVGSWCWGGREAPVTHMEASEAFAVTAVSRDGALLAAAMPDGSARLWAIDGTPLRSLDVAGARVVGLEFSPDGARVAAVASDGTAHMSTTRGAGEAVVLRGHQGVVNGGAFSADGTRVVTASGDRTARVWCLEGRDAPIVSAVKEWGR